MREMKKVALGISTICALAINLSASDLGMIQVESSTINDNEQNTKTEVSSTAIITREDVEEINPHTISDLLNGVPGVTLSNVGTDSVKVHIRGVDNQMYMGEKPGVAIVIDGVPVQETTGKINVDLDNIESIKVIKGGASYLYGNDALAGAVIITTKKAKGKSSSKVEGEVGSFNSKRFIAATNQAFENSALQIQGTYRTSDGYWDDAYVDIKAINGKYVYYINDTSDVTFGLDYTKRKTGDGNSVSGTIEAKENPTSEGYYSYGGYYNSDLIKGFVTYSNNITDNSNVMLRLHSYEDDKNYKLARYTRDMFEDWKQTGAKGEYKLNFNSLAFMAGVDIQRNTTDELGYDVVDGTAPRGGSDGDLLNDFKTKENINAFYSELKYQVSKDLTTTLNFRFDNIEQEYINNFDSNDNVNPRYNVASYRIGATYALTDNTALYASFSTGFRTPTVGQISSNKVALQNNPTLDVPANINVETSYNYEIGVRGNISDYNFNASVFQLNRNNYIGKVAGSYITSDDENESVYDNVGDMRSRGLELALNSNRAEKLSFDLAYTYLNAVFTNYTISQQLTVDPDGPYRPLTATYQRVDLSGNQVPRTPKHTMKLTLHYKPAKEALISTEIVAKSSYYADEVNRYKQPGYGVVNLIGEYNFTKALRLFGRIDNLLNKDYYQFVNINSSALANMETDATIRVAPPRAGYVGLAYSF